MLPGTSSLVRVFIVLAISLSLYGLVESAPAIITQAIAAACNVALTGCCLNASSANIVNVTPFVPPLTTTVRTRRSLESALKDPVWFDKYKRAVSILKSSGRWQSQRLTHCAYANRRSLGLNIHGNWNFLPWHRWYLYFHEKMLQTALNDTTFMLPFWDWGTSSGRKVFPEFYVTSSSIYDSARSSSATTTSLLGSYTANSQMVAAVVNPASTNAFFGESLATNISGALDRSVHGGVHVAVGRQSDPYFDMGAISMASNDALFWTHHANVDRLWWIWKRLPPNSNGVPRTEPTSTDWLDTQYIFYDEKGALRSVKVRDCVDTRRLGYVYQEVPNPWLPAGITLSPPPGGPPPPVARRLLSTDGTGSSVDRQASSSLDAAETGPQGETTLMEEHHGRHLHQAGNSSDTPTDTIPPDVANLPTRSGPRRINADATTVRLRRFRSRERGSGFQRTERDSTGRIRKRGRLNTEFLTVRGLQLTENRPTFVNFFINNPYADKDTETSFSNGFCGSLTHVPTDDGDGLPAPKTVLLQIENCLALTGNQNRPALTITMVSYGLDPNTGERVGLENQVSSVGDIYLQYK